jgi:hypothetical protein
MIVKSEWNLEDSEPGDSLELLSVISKCVLLSHNTCCSSVYRSYINILSFIVSS